MSSRGAIVLPTLEEIERLEDPAEIRAARLAAGLTQRAAGELVRAGARTWQDWERGERGMPEMARELFLIKLQFRD